MFWTWNTPDYANNLLFINDFNITDFIFHDMFDSTTFFIH